MKKLIIVGSLSVAVFLCAIFLPKRENEEEAPVIDVEEESCSEEELDGYAISLSIENMAKGFSGNLQKNDIVAVLIWNQESMEYEWDDNLCGLRVITTTTKEGINVEDNLRDAEGQIELPSTVTLEVNEWQAIMLANAEDSGKYHIVLLQRGTE